MKIWGAYYVLPFDCLHLYIPRLLQGLGKVTYVQCLTEQHVAAQPTAATVVTKVSGYRFGKTKMDGF